MHFSLPNLNEKLPLRSLLYRALPRVASDKIFFACCPEQRPQCMPLLEMSVSAVRCQYSIVYSFDPVFEYLRSKFSCIRYLAMFVEKILYVLRAQCAFNALRFASRGKLHSQRIKVILFALNT